MSTGGGAPVVRSNAGCKSFLLDAMRKDGDSFDTSRCGVLGTTTRRVGRVRKGLAVLRRGCPNYKGGPSDKRYISTTDTKVTNSTDGLVGFPDFGNGSLSNGSMGDDSLFSNGAMAMIGF